MEPDGSRDRHTPPGPVSFADVSRIEGPSIRRSEDHVVERPDDATKSGSMPCRGDLSPTGSLYASLRMTRYFMTPSVILKLRSSSAGKSAGASKCIST